MQICSILKPLFRNKLIQHRLSYWNYQSQILLVEGKRSIQKIFFHTYMCADMENDILKPLLYCVVLVRMYYGTIYVLHRTVLNWWVVGGVLWSNTRTAAINLYLLHCDAELRTEGQTRAGQATISISDGGNVCQAYTNNKMGKNDY